MKSSRIAAFPFWRDNPYQNLLYLASCASGHEIVPSRTVDELYESVSTLMPGDVIHLHWTSPIIQRARDLTDAEDRLNIFIRTLTGSKNRGIKLIWTIHNALPHETHFMDQELALCRFLAEAADVVHVMSPATLDAIADLYPVDPSKAVVVAHSSYWGVYDHEVDVEASRARHGLTPRNVGLALIGQLRPYKGVDVLIDAVAELRAVDDSYIGMLAGKTTDDDIATIDRLLEPHDGFVRHHGFITDKELPTWICAADIIVIPYRRVLNSGSILLAATFGRPVVVPDEPALRDQYGDQPWVWFYAADSGASALTALIRDKRQAIVDSGPAAMEWAQRHTPYQMAREFRDKVLSRVSA